MIISLTGFMGCGKSSVGRRLSELLCCRFMDLDKVIEERTGRTIPEIFSTDGEAAFRAIESNTLRDIVVASEPRQCVPLAPSHSKAAGPSPYAGVRKCQFHTHASSPISVHDVIARGEATWQSVNMVLALGGGAVMTGQCAEVVHSDTICIYLKASIETLLEHLYGQTKGRPLLNDTNCHSDQAERVKESAIRERIENLMAQRSSTYEKTAHIIIDTDGKSIEAVALEIISILG
jgi:shikimate kinase